MQTAEFELQKFFAGIIVAFGIKQIGRKFRVENFLRGGNGKFAQKIFQSVQSDFAREVRENFLQFVTCRRKNFSAENFHDEIIDAARDRNFFRRENFFTVECRNFRHGQKFFRRVKKIRHAEKFMNFFLRLVERVTIAKFVDACKVGRHRKIFCVKIHVGHVATNLREFFTHAGIVDKSFKRVTNFFLLDFRSVLQNIFERAEVAD